MRILLANACMAVALVALLGSCAQKITRPTADRYELDITDNAAERRFDVSLKSADNRAVCVSVENWPNSSGHFTVEKDDTYLQVGPNRLPAKSKLMSAYCPGGCGKHRVEPNSSLRGFISYEVFGDPENLAKEPQKRLNFPVSPHYCP